MALDYIENILFPYSHLPNKVFSFLSIDFLDLRRLSVSHVYLGLKVSLELEDNSAYLFMRRLLDKIEKCFCSSNKCETYVELN